MPKHNLLLAALLPVVLSAAACGSADEAGNNGSDQAGQIVEDTPSNLQDDQNNSVVPLTAPTAAPAPSPTPVATLPPGFHGRWGMVDKDCDPAMDNAAKGLMVVAADGLKFYESRGRVEQARAVRPNTVELDLAFTGEGQEWNRRETLTLLDGGRTLMREEQKPAGSFRYIKCPAGRDTTA